MQHTTRRLVRPRTALATGALTVGLVALGSTSALAAQAPISPGITAASITAPAAATVGDVVDASIALTGTS